MERGVSIHIGVNHPATLTGELLTLSEDVACEMARVAFQAGYRAIHVLCGAEATCASVSALLTDTARSLAPGDTLFVTYSGHGSQTPDDELDRDDRDGQDETWCLADGDLKDDQVAECWRQLPRGSRAVVLIESCFGGGAARDVTLAAWLHALKEAYAEEVIYRTFEWDEWDEGNGWDGGGMRGVPQAVLTWESCVSPPKEDDGIAASVLVLAAAGENQKAREGLYTRCLLEVWKAGQFRDSFCELHQQVSILVKNENSDQVPVIRMLGAPDPEFPLKVAFHLDNAVTR